MSSIPDVPGCSVTADPHGLTVTHAVTGDTAQAEHGAEAHLMGAALHALAEIREGDNTGQPGFAVRIQQWAAVWQGRLTSEQVEQLKPDEHPDYSFTFWATPDTDGEGNTLWTVTIATPTSVWMLAHLCATWLREVAELTKAKERP